MRTSFVSRAAMASSFSLVVLILVTVVVGGEKRSPAESKVEKDGVEFEMLLPDRAWVLPETKAGAKTAVKLALRITNRTEKPLRFSRFGTICPQLASQDGKLLRASGGRNVTLAAKESDFPLVGPGKSTTFEIDAQLFWQDDTLRFGGSDGFGGVWSFSEGLKPGAFKCRIHYENQRGSGLFQTEKQAENKEEPSLVRGLWLGVVDTPLVNVSIVEPGTRTVIKRPAQLVDGRVVAETESPGAIERDQVKFEILDPDREWPIPENRPGNSSTVPLGLRITNESDKPLRFSGFGTLSLELQDPDGKEAVRWKGPYRTFRSRPAKASDFPLILPGKSVTFSIQGGLFWPTLDDRTLFFRWWHASGSPGHFYEKLKPGHYMLRIVYENLKSSFHVEDPTPEDFKDHVWMGRIETPFVEVVLKE